MIELIFVSAVVMGCLIYMQKQHYDYIERKERVKKSLDKSFILEAHLKDFEEMKKRLDVLTLKAGFKL